MLLTIWFELTILTTHRRFPRKSADLTKNLTKNKFGRIWEKNMFFETFGTCWCRFLLLFSAQPNGNDVFPTKKWSSEVRAPWLNLEIRPGGQTHQIFTIFGDLVSLPLLGNTRRFPVSGPLFDREKMDYHSAGRKNAAPFREPHHGKCES